MPDTPSQYNSVIEKCRSLFEKKTKDYGTAWRIMRMPTLTDQIWIKAKRIRSIQEKKSQLVSDSIQDEFMGIINYSIIAIIQDCISKIDEGLIHAPIYDVSEKALDFYDEVMRETKTLLSQKNHDYDEAWREMRITSLVDIILMKLIRIKQIEDNDGKTLISEGIVSGYRDIINYSVFALILMWEEDSLTKL